MNTTFVQVFAPTDFSGKATDETLQGTLANILKKDATILMGDLNAKIGKSKVKTDNIGTFGYVGFET